MRLETRRRWAIAGLTGPAYLWLTLTIFLPLSAMLYFSFLTSRRSGATSRCSRSSTIGAFLDARLPAGHDLALADHGLPRHARSAC